MVKNKKYTNSSISIQKDFLGIYPIPSPEKPEPISEHNLQIALNGSLSKLTKVVTPLPEDPSRVRTELFRQYRFKLP